MSFLNFRWLRYFKLRQYKALIVVFVLLLGVTSVIGYFIPQYISKLYEYYEDSERFFLTIKMLLVFVVSQYIVRFVYQLLLSWYIRNLLQTLREDLFESWIRSHDKVMTSNRVFIAQDKYTRGEFQARLMNDTEAIRELITTGSLTIFIDFIFVISCMIGFLSIHKFYGVTLILAEGLVCFLLLRLSKTMAVYYRRVRKSAGNLSRVLSNLSNGFRQLFFTRHDSYPIKVSLPSFEKFLKLQLQANLWDAGYYSLAESLFPILLALVIIVFPYSEVTSVAILAALIDLIQRSIGPIKDIASKVSNIQRAMTGVQRIVELDQDLKSVVADGFEVEGEEVDSMRLEVKSFRYPKTLSDFQLEEIKLEIKKGEKVGIVGLSGSGKSTLLKLLSGEIFSDKIVVDFFTGGKRSVSFDGSDLSDINKLKGYICMISQDSYVFNESLVFNITFDHKPEDFETFWSDIKMQIPYVERWGISPEDIVDTNAISLGQKQLISALRFCYHKKPIALFDEISSSLDGELEEALSQFIQLVSKDVMLIIVAHRLETLINCDQIIFLENGRQVDQGSHRSLYERHGSYQAFFHALGP